MPVLCIAIKACKARSSPVLVSCVSKQSGLLIATQVCICAKQTGLDVMSGEEV